MINESSTYFKGFSIDTIDFLKNLNKNNNKIWFDKNKDCYKKFLLEPMKYLAIDMSDFILSIDPLIDTTPSPGKSISRINRDTRFSKDKSPYKDTMWITFKRPSKEWSSNPSFFFEISPTSYRYGMGFFSATPRTMELFRERIDRSPKEFEKAISFYAKQHNFVLEGDKYKRTLAEDMPEFILDWYQRKNLYLVCNKNIDNALYSNQLITELKSNFNLISDFYHYLYKIR